MAELNLRNYETFAGIAPVIMKRETLWAISCNYNHPPLPSALQVA
jgi:hypothetical protein